uniref:Calpain 8 n=1 Tax=Junco hyemalis TaxID=40217 RepID=A0A8C5ILU4_JUNHY
LALKLHGVSIAMNAVKYLKQDYEALKQQPLKTGTLFKDEEFPVCPSEFCANPQSIIGGATQTDVCQRELCMYDASEFWFGRRKRNEASFKNSCYFGHTSLHHLFLSSFPLFWQCGEWVDVVVDNRLPTKNREILFLHSDEGNKFWSMLLEKAYTKLNSSFEALAGGSTVEGFEEFTGGISESYKLRRITAAAEIEAITSLKLVNGHAYSVTRAEEIRQPEKLVRLRNPWGEVEWTGSWNFQRQFSHLEICSLTPDILTSHKVNKWDLTLFNGQWRWGSSAGGCQNYQEIYWTNPQFKIQLDEPNDDHEGSLNEPCLMQKNHRRQKRMKEGLLSIGYLLYQVKFFLESSTDVHAAARTDPCVNLHEVSSHMMLPWGQYCIPYKNGETALQIALQCCIIQLLFLHSSFLNKGILIFEPCLNMTQTDGPSTLRLVEFKTLWMKIQKYLVTTFLTLSPCFRLKDEVQHSIVICCTCSPKLTIDFNGFVACMICLETLFNEYLRAIPKAFMFYLLDKDKNGVIQISLPEVSLVRLKYHLIQLQQ